jgi:hypothetical protein
MAATGGTIPPVAKPSVDIGSADTLRPSGSGWTFDSGEVFGQDTAGTPAHGERVGFNVYTVLGFDLNTAPSLSTMRQELLGKSVTLASGQTVTIADVLYLEQWHQDNTILGTGWISYYYIGVWTS